MRLKEVIQATPEDKPPLHERNRRSVLHNIGYVKSEQELV